MSTVYSIIYLSVRGEQGETKTLFPMVWHVILFSFYLFILQVGANFRMMVCTLSNEKVHLNANHKEELENWTSHKEHTNFEPLTSFLCDGNAVKVQKLICFSCFPEFVRYFIPLVIAQPCSSYGFRVMLTSKEECHGVSVSTIIEVTLGSEVHSLSLIKLCVVFGIWRKFVWFWVSRRFFSHESLKSYSCWANQKRFLSLCSAFRSILHEGFFFLKLQDTHRTQFIQTTQIKIESLFVPFIKI